MDPARQESDEAAGYTVPTTEDVIGPTPADSEGSKRRRPLASHGAVRDGGWGSHLETFGAALSAFEDFVYVLTADVRFTYANRALLDLWGLGLDDIVGKGFAELGYPPDLVKLHGLQVAEVIETRRPVYGENAYVAPSLEEGYYEYIFSPVFGAGGKVEAVAGITRDVTERRRAADALQQSTRDTEFWGQLSEALRALSDPAVVQAEAARVLGEHLGASRVHYAEVDAEVAVGTVEADYHPGVPSVAGRHKLDDYGPTVMDVVRAGQTLVISNVAEDQRLTESEREATVELQIGAYIMVPLFKGGHTRAFLVVHHSQPHAWTEAEVALIEETAERTWSTVERARAEAEVRELNRALEKRVEERTVQVRSLSRALTMAEHEERRRLAHVLHDDLQQVLYGAQIQAERGNAERVAAILKDAIQTARSLSHELAPPILRGRGLGELFEWLERRELDLYGLEVDHDAGDVEVPEEAVRVLLYRVLRELLFNVSKHSGVDRAWVRAEPCDGGVRVIVEDDGAGIDAATVAEMGGGGLGLASVRERLEAVGGRLAVESVLGEGTRVVIDVPAGLVGPGSG